MDYGTYGVVINYPCPQCSQPTLTLLVDWEWEDNSESYYTPSFYYPVCWVEKNECECDLVNDDKLPIEEAVMELICDDVLNVGKPGAGKVLDFEDWHEGSNQ